MLSSILLADENLQRLQGCFVIIQQNANIYDGEKKKVFSEKM